MSQDVRGINFLPGSCHLSMWLLWFQLGLWTSLVLHVYVPVNACFPVSCSCLRNCTEALQPRLGVGSCIPGHLLGKAVISEGVCGQVSSDEGLKSEMSLFPSVEGRRRVGRAEQETAGFRVEGRIKGWKVLGRRKG
jgi:hypothetical protein